VRFSDEEYARVRAGAAAMGNLSPAAYLAERATAPLVMPAAGTPLSAPQLRALAAELYALKRILRGASTNLNQLAMVANATGEFPTEAVHHARRIAEQRERLDAFLATVQPWLTT